MSRTEYSLLSSAPESPSGTKYCKIQISHVVSQYLIGACNSYSALSVLSTAKTQVELKVTISKFKPCSRSCVSYRFSMNCTQCSWESITESSTEY